ncbi:unnamed protein product [Victoria cruziana]
MGMVSSPFPVLYSTRQMVGNQTDREIVCGLERKIVETNLPGDLLNVGDDNSMDWLGTDFCKPIRWEASRRLL